MASTQTYNHQNIMEILVTQEVERHMNQLDSKLARYINQVEVETHALNHLPPLYASSEEGRRQQELKAQKEFGEQIAIAVRRAFAAVQRDPLRLSTPLERAEDPETQEAQAALQTLRDLLQRKELSWQNLVNVVQQALTRAPVQPKKDTQTDYGSVNQQSIWSKYDWNDYRYHR
ncbi:MAG: competence protein ComFB [Cyanothece sp. SIO1E1]|nr:competence protein ComFB [Cyanothece sp. SIO1E1]